MVSLNNILQYVIITVFCIVIGGLLLHFFKNKPFTKINSYFKWFWLNFKFYITKYWIPLFIIVSTLTSIYFYRFYNNGWIFLIAYSFVITVIVLFKKRSVKLTPALYCILGDKDSESGTTGLKFIDYHDDGKAIRELYNDRYIRRSDNRNSQYYLYFAIEDFIVRAFRGKPVLLALEYLDLDDLKNNRGIQLEYDAKGKGVENKFKKGGKSFLQVRILGSQNLLSLMMDFLGKDDKMLRILDFQL